MDRAAAAAARGTVPTDGFVWALASLCRLHRVPFDPELVLRQFPPPYDLTTLLRAAEACGLKAGLAGARPAGPLAFRTLVDLRSQHLESDGQRYLLAPGMQVMAEIHLGSRTILEYLLSPVRKAFHEAGRER